MTRVRTPSEHLSTDRHRSQDVEIHQGRDASLHGDVCVEQALESRNTTSQTDALKQIASLSPAQRGKVLNIRRQIAEGTYELADRLDKAIDRVLETITS